MQKSFATVHVYTLAFVLAALVCAFYPHAATGQAVTGTIAGVVTDPSGARIPGLEVSALNVLTGVQHKASTDTEGNYLFPVLPVGQYRLEVEAPGFGRFVRDGIILDVNRNARVDITLTVGAVSEEVRVVADSPLVDTRQVQLGGLVDSRRISELPLNGRNVYDLVAVLPGVTSVRFPTVHDNQGNYLNVNGSRSRHSTFLLDGAFNNDLWRNSGNSAPNPDAVEQFRLITSNFNAEFGRSPGAVLNVVTKSGTNELHGSVWEFIRNSKLNARNFFNPTVEPLRQNQFGASVGGPILRNRTFFFGSYQGLRVRSSAFTNSGLPATEAERRGDFSASGTRPNDPETKQPFPDGIIPANRLDPVALQILSKLIPLPNTSDGRLEALEPTRSNEDQVVGKIDHQITQAHKIYGTLFLVQGKGFDPFPAGTQAPNYITHDTILNQRNVVVNEDWMISPTTLNQVRFSFTRRLSELASDNQTSWSDFGSQVKLGALPPRPPTISISGRLSLGASGTNVFTQQSYGLSDSVTLIRGRHSIKVGAWLLRNSFDEVGNYHGAGQIQFSGAFSGVSMADFVLGRSSRFRQNNGQDRHFRSTNLHTFVQDDWQVHRKLMLNLGLRWELNSPYVSTTDELQTFRFGVASLKIPKAPLGLQFPGDPGIPRSTVKTDKNNFAPRIGLAFDPFGNGRTAIRAGYGVFYAIGFANNASDLQGQPFVVDYTLFDTPNLVDPYANVPGGSPFPYKLDPANPLFILPLTASYMSENLATPYVQHYSLTLEQQLRSNLSLQVAYVGNTSRKLVSQRDANAALFGPGASSSNVNARRPYLPGVFAQIAHTESAANAHYDSLQVTLNRRFGNGFSVMASYTYSKSMEELSDDKFNPTGVLMVDSNNRRLERAPSSSNPPQVFVVSYFWRLPGTARFGPVGKQILSGWQLSGITRIESGAPFNVVSGSDRNLDGNNNDRPNLLGNPALPSNRSRQERLARFFDTSAFGPAPLGTNGTAGRNLIYGPGSVSWDASLFKGFEIREQRELQFRADLFNLPNRVNLGNPNATMSSSNFGRILSASSARVVQFSLKFVF